MFTARYGLSLLSFQGLIEISACNFVGVKCCDPMGGVQVSQPGPCAQ